MKTETILPDAPQGDLNLARLDERWPDLAKTLNRDKVLKSFDRAGAMRLLEGEISGHHHVVERLSLHNIPHLHDEALARDLQIAATNPTVATLYDDPALLDRLIRSDFASPDRPERLRDLYIGFLVVESFAVPRTHPEHDTIVDFKGVHFVGRQVESFGTEERRVND